MDFGNERIAAERQRHGNVPRRDEPADFAYRNRQGRRPDDYGHAVAKLNFDKSLTAVPTFIIFEASKGAEQASRVSANNFSKCAGLRVKCVAFSTTKVVYLTIPAMFGGACQNLCNKNFR